MKTLNEQDVEHVAGNGALGALAGAWVGGVIGAAAGMIAAGATAGLLAPAGVAATMGGAAIGASFGSALAGPVVVVMDETSLTRRRIAWGILAILVVISGPLFVSVREWRSYWLVSIGAAIALVPMLYREPARGGVRAWLPMVLCALCSLGGLVLVFLRPG